MSKARLFIDNFLVYGIGGVINKLIPFLMLPIITRLMPDSSYFGLSDISNKLYTLVSTFAIMGVYDAAFRMFFDKEDLEYRKNICSTALLIVLLNSIILSILLNLFDDLIIKLFFGNSEYAILLYLVVFRLLIGSTNTILSIPTRVQNKRIVFLSVNFLSSSVAYLIAMILLFEKYYLIALSVGSLCSAFLTGIVFYILNKKWFSISSFKFQLLKKLLYIALPIMPVIFVYWVLESCDRIFIVNLLGDVDLGIYSACAKISMVSQLIYLAFTGGWQYFAFSTMHEENQVRNNSLIFEYLGIVSFLATSFICAIAYYIIKIFYPIEYQCGYIVVPYLFLSPLLLMMFQVIGNQFLVIKKTWPCTIIIFFGGIINLLGCYFLIPQLGIEGASIATMSGYFFSVLICIMVLIKMHLLEIKKRFIYSTILFFLNIIVWRIFTQENILEGILVFFILVIFYMFFYREEVSSIKYILKKRINY